LRRLLLTLLACVALSAACDDGEPAPSPAATPTARPLPQKVVVREEPQGIGLNDPAFEALPGAKAHFGRLGGAVYQIEVPDAWNGRLVLYMHGFQGLATEASVDAPSIRAYLIRNGFAWGASSYSSTALIPGRGADETAALWDEFVGRFGRPSYTYLTGHSMGGAASHIAAERYPDRYDGVLGLCGDAGQTAITQIVGDYLFAGAYAAGVTQDEFDSTAIDVLINERIKPALREATAHDLWVRILLDMTGGERAHDRAGFELEEGTNWDRAQILVSFGLAYNEGREYNLGPLAGVTREDFNAKVVRKAPTLPENIENFNDGNELAGELQVKMLTMHTTGDWQVPIDQQQILRQKVDAAGKSDLLVQRIVRDASHCGFLDSEWEQGLEDLIAWVEEGEKPGGEDVLVADLREAGRTFTRAPRFGSPEADAIDGADERVTLRGRATLDGEPLAYAFVWAEVVEGGIRRLCSFDGAPPSDGRYERTLVSETEMAGCGALGMRIRLGASVQGKTYRSANSIAWPVAGGGVRLDVDFSSADVARPADDATAVYGSVFDAAGLRMPRGTRIEALNGATLCGVIGIPAAVMLFQSPDSYDLLVAGPEAVAGCERGGTITFKVNGKEVAQTAINDVEGDGVPLDLTVR